MHNVINIKSEILFREAEDYFLYFGKTKKAIQKLDEAIILTPYHTKSLVLRGDISFISGKIDEALNLYEKAYTTFSNDSKILGAIATCLESKEDYRKALSYCDKAFLFINENNCQLLQSLYELKISILLRLKEYKKAQKLIADAKYNLSTEEIIKFKNHREVINIKLKIKEKIKSSSLHVL